MIRFLFKIVAALVVAFIIIWMIFVYPRDSRVIFKDSQHSLGKRIPLKIAFSAFHSADFLSHTMDLSVYKKFLEETLPSKKFKTILTSARFKNNYQFYLSSGFYPERLQGFDAVALPDNDAEILLMPKLAGDQFTFFSQILAPFGDASLTVNVDDKILTKVTIKQLPVFPDLFRSFYRPILRYLKINYPEDLTGWHPLKLKLPELTRSSQIKISCSSDSTPTACILSEPLILKNMETKRTNVIMILLDTLRSDGVNPRYMPELDAFRQVSHDYKNALSPGNMTGPSSNALLNCQIPSHIEKVAFSYAISPKDREEFYEKNTPSFTWALRENGFYTAMVGNVSLISEVYGIGVNHGFYENISIEQEAYDTPKIAKETLRWLDEHGNTNFFLYVHLDGGHAPYRPPLSYFSGQDLLDVKPFSMPSLLKFLYNGELSYTDFYLGKIFTGLKERGLFDSSHIIITSDHADHQSEHQFTHNLAGKVYKGAYFDHGATLLNDEMHVPLLIKPASNTHHDVHEHFVSNIAIGPTILELTATPIPSYCEASSLLPQISERPTVENLKNIIGLEGFRMRGILFDQRYKYIKSYETTEKRLYSEDKLGHQKSFVLEPEQLFDLIQDPQEEHNLIDIDSELKTIARQKFAQHYGFTQGYKITVYPDKTSELAILLRGVSPSAIRGYGSLSVKSLGAYTEISGSISTATEIFIDGALEEWPKIFLNSSYVSQYATRTQLPLENISAIPTEITSSDHVAGSYENEASIVISRVYFDNMKSRMIKSGNIEFEAVLRQWGYLQDDQN